MSDMLGGAAPIALMLALLLTLVVGLLLGMVGGGGSIMVVPILVYVVGLPAAAAIALSLPIVGLTALAGATVKARCHEVHGRAVLLLGLAGAVGAVLGSRLTTRVPSPILLLLFATLLFTVGWKMWRGGDRDEVACDNECRTGRCVVAGWIVGVLTGFLGVGGGFLLVPALRRFAHQEMKLAVGTSLGIIALNSAVGFAAHWGSARGLLPLGVMLSVAALLGMWGGLNLAGRVPARALEKTFAAVALGLSGYLALATAPAALQIIT